MLICCTAKLVKEMGLAKAVLVNNVSEKSSLGEWYANLFFFGRKKCVIFTNALTLFTFISFYVNKAQIKDLGSLFRVGLGKALLDENFEGALIKRLVDKCQAIQFAGTNNRSVIVRNSYFASSNGSMYCSASVYVYIISRIYHHNITF